MEEKREKAYKEFENYIKNFDLNNEMIFLKYKHTFRVIDYIEQISEAEGLNDDDRYIAFVCALLHDIARFKQAEEYGTFNDTISFDHGDEGVNILKNNNFINKFIDNNEDKNIALKAIKNHNKLNIDNSLSERELYFSKLLRDADKIDIMDFLYNKVVEEKKEIPAECVNAVYEKRTVDKKKLNVDEAKQMNTKIIILLCLIWDINFDMSREIISKNNIIGRKIEILSNYVDNDFLNIIKEKMSKFI